MRRLPAAAAAVGLALGCAATLERPVDARDLAGLIERTERARQQSFVEPLDLRAVAPRALPLLAERELDLTLPPERLRAVGRALEAVGVLPAGTDLRRAYFDIHRELAAGYYTPLFQRIYVVMPEPSLSLRMPRLGRHALDLDANVLIHELTHALQAMHSTLMEVALGLGDNDDLLFAVGATLEGQALWTEYRDAEIESGLRLPPPGWVWSQIDPERILAESSGIPRALIDPFVRQYPAGYELTLAIAERDGVAGLDAALASPPLSSEQVLHPERFLDPAQRDLPRFLELPERIAPSPSCRELHRNTFGELGLRIWLAERVDAAADALHAAADGWDGDRYVAFACPTGVVFAWLVELDAAAEADELAAAAAAATLGLDGLRGLAGPPRVDVRDTRVLVSAGLGDDARAAVLRDTRARELADLDAFLAAYPGVMARARELRRRAREVGTLELRPAHRPDAAVVMRRLRIPATGAR